MDCPVSSGAVHIIRMFTYYEQSQIVNMSGGLDYPIPKHEGILPKFGVSTKSQLGVKRAIGLNSVKQSVSEKASKNEETAFACGILIGGLVPKGGLEPPRVTSHAPQTCASASSATSAQVVR